MLARRPADVSFHDRSGIKLFALERKATALVDNASLVCRASFISSLKSSHPSGLPGLPVMHAYLLTFTCALDHIKKLYAAFIFQDLATMGRLVPEIKSHLITRGRKSLQYEDQETVWDTSVAQVRVGYPFCVLGGTLRKVDAEAIIAEVVAAVEMDLRPVEEHEAKVKVEA